MGPRLKDVEDSALLDGRPIPPDGASMGPRLKDVEDLVATLAVNNAPWLQWGHVSRTWKTPGSVPASLVFGKASMGPRLKDVEDLLNSS